MIKVLKVLALLSQPMHYFNYNKTGNGAYEYVSSSAIMYGQINTIMPNLSQSTKI
jgi:hypothetical protein